MQTTERWNCLDALWEPQVLLLHFYLAPDRLSPSPVNNDSSLLLLSLFVDLLLCGWQQLCQSEMQLIISLMNFLFFPLCSCAAGCKISRKHIEKIRLLTVCSSLERWCLQCGVQLWFELYDKNTRASSAAGEFLFSSTDRTFSLHQPPGAEDFPESPATSAIRHSPLHKRRLGDLQGRLRSTLLLQPLDTGEDLEAPPNQGHQHWQLQRK